MSTTIPALFLDELRDRAVRSPEELTPGTEVLFAHVPDLLDPWTRSTPDRAYASIGTVVEVSMKHYHELHEGRRPHSGSEPSLVITYRRQDTGERDYIYAADTGVTPYGDPGHEVYNPANFAVLLEPLAEEGIVVFLRASDGFQKELADFNSLISPGYYGVSFRHRIFEG